MSQQPIKIKYQKQIHVYKGSMILEDLEQFIQNSFNKLPQPFFLHYKDNDGDNITLSCDEDIQAMLETTTNSDGISPKVFIEAGLVELSSNSSTEFQEILSKEQEEEQKMFVEKEKQRSQELNKIMEELNELIKNPPVVEKQKQEQEKKANICPMCTYQNAEDAVQCEICFSGLVVVAPKKQEGKQLVDSACQMSSQKLEETFTQTLEVVQKEEQTQFDSKPEYREEQTQVEQPQKSVMAVQCEPLEQAQQTSKNNSPKDIFHCEQSPMLIMQDAQNYFMHHQPPHHHVPHFGPFGGKEGMSGHFKEKKRAMINEMVQLEIKNQMPQIVKQVRESLKSQKAQKKKCKKDKKDKKKKGSISLSSAQKTDNMVKHHRVICDGCEKNSIIGVRYKCAVCPDFDYCQECEGTKEHNHPFLKIRRPELAPKMIITALQEDEIPQNILNVCPQQASELIQGFQQEQKKPSQKTSEKPSQHIFEDMLVDLDLQKKARSPNKKANTIKKCAQKKGVKSLPQKEESVTQISSSQEKVSIKEIVENDVQKAVDSSVPSYAVVRCGKHIAEILGGKGEEYYEVIEKNKQSSIKKIIEIIMQQRSTLKNNKNFQQKEEEQTQQPKSETQNKKVYSSRILRAAQKVQEVLGGKLEELCERISEFPEIGIDEILETLMVENESNAQEKEKPKEKEAEMTLNDTPSQQQEDKKEKVLKKTFSTTVKARAAQVSEILERSEMDYYGIVDAMILNSVDDLIGMILNDATLMDKHSSYN